MKILDTSTTSWATYLQKGKLGHADKTKRGAKKEVHRPVDVKRVPPVRQKRRLCSVKIRCPEPGQRKTKTWWDVQIRISNGRPSTGWANPRKQVEPVAPLYKHGRAHQLNHLIVFGTLDKRAGNEDVLGTYFHSFHLKLELILFWWFSSGSFCWFWWPLLRPIRLPSMRLVQRLRIPFRAFRLLKWFCSTPDHECSFCPTRPT